MPDKSQAEKAAATDNEAPEIQTHEGFTLVHGGLIDRLLARAGMLQPSMGLLHRRMLVCVLVTWLPLAALTALAGSLMGGSALPFLYDLDVHVRLLISLPLLIGAELIIHRRMRTVVAEFLDRGLVAPDDRPRFEALIARAMRLRNSVVVELLLLGFAFTGGYWVWRTQTTLHIATWYSASAEGTRDLTVAGYWYGFVSLPIARFILLRWYFRLFIWYLFLWRASRLPLRLNPLHPDRVGGLGFLENSVDAFSPVLIAQSAFFSGVIGSLILHEGAKLRDFQLEILGFVVFQMLLVLLPLMFFVFRMVEAKLVASHEFGGLASRYVSGFRQKWLNSGKASDDSLLGSGDIQSLADLANCYEVVRGMRLVPFDRGLVLRLGILIALPLLPLILTMIPVDEIVERLIKLLL